MDKPVVNFEQSSLWNDPVVEAILTSSPFPNLCTLELVVRSCIRSISGFSNFDPNIDIDGDGWPGQQADPALLYCLRRVLLCAVVVKYQEDSLLELLDNLSDDYSGVWKPSTRKQVALFNVSKICCEFTSNFFRNSQSQHLIADFKDILATCNYIDPSSNSVQLLLDDDSSGSLGPNVALIHQPLYYPSVTEEDNSESDDYNENVIMAFDTSILEGLHRRGDSFRFWMDWFEAACLGKPQNWELLREIALIENAIWNRGAESVAAEIERIRENHAQSQGRSDVKPETVDAKSITTLFDRAPVVQASMTSLSEAISMRVDVFERLERPNEFIPFYETLKGLPITAQKIATLVGQGKQTSGDDTALAIEVGRLRAEVDQLKSNLKTAYADIEKLKEKPWYRKTSVLLAGGAVPAMLTALWVLSGEDKALEQRWNKLASDIEFLQSKVWPNPEDRFPETLRFELPESEQI